MNLGLQNCVIIIPIENSCIELNNKKIHSLQRYDITQHFRILQCVSALVPT
jgi:hypothetical protein